MKPGFLPRFAWCQSLSFELRSLLVPRFLCGRGSVITHFQIWVHKLEAWWICLFGLPRSLAIYSNAWGEAGPSPVSQSQWLLLSAEKPFELLHCLPQTSLPWSRHSTCPPGPWGFSLYHLTLGDSGENYLQLREHIMAFVPAIFSMEICLITILQIGLCWI